MKVIRRRFRIISLGLHLRLGISPGRDGRHGAWVCCAFCGRCFQPCSTAGVGALARLLGYTEIGVPGMTVTDDRPASAGEGISALGVTVRTGAAGCPRSLL